MLIPCSCGCALTLHKLWCWYADQARFFRAKAPKAKVVYPSVGDGAAWVAPMALRCSRASRLTCAVLDMVTLSAACPLLHIALDAARRSDRLAA